MFDIWAFLLQTLTASGVALLILMIKGMFRDKLPPKWQFGIWGVLGVAMLLPAGLGGRYALVNWPMIVDTLSNRQLSRCRVQGSYLFLPIQSAM